MRQIALDTETTGLSTEQGHRIIEIGCIEIIDRKITGNNFHCYIDPDREIDPNAFAVHGISNNFLLGKPRFKAVFNDLIAYVADAELIIHNAPFDVGFLNYEFSLINHSKQMTEYCSIFDTLPFARQRHPGQKNSLDALCKRYEIDNAHRQLHGALLDADLLARIYLAMTGGQGSLFSEEHATSHDEHAEIMKQLVRDKPLPVMGISAEEESAHLKFVEILSKNGGTNLWDED
ncbi:MAG: DNA polymerase III subunit epsilon [Gammaproteobacteria bacterium]|nr:DNA polymerase III subunit epsilon [Gammaproteobacteria bacterium]